MQMQIRRKKHEINKRNPEKQTRRETAPKIKKQYGIASQRMTFLAVVAVHARQANPCSYTRPSWLLVEDSLSFAL